MQVNLPQELVQGGIGSGIVGIPKYPCYGTMERAFDYRRVSGDLTPVLNEAPYRPLHAE